MKDDDDIFDFERDSHDFPMESEPDPVYTFGVDLIPSSIRRDDLVTRLDKSIFRRIFYLKFGRNIGDKP